MDCWKYGQGKNTIKGCVKFCAPSEYFFQQTGVYQKFNDYTHFVGWNKVAPSELIT